MGFSGLTPPHWYLVACFFSPLWNNPQCRTPKVKEKIIHYPSKMKKSEMRCNSFQVIISLTFQYWRPIVLDWFPCETCQFSFVFQFATASVQGHSLCWITKRLFSWPLPCILTASLWSGCQINCVIYWYEAELWQLSDRHYTVYSKAEENESSVDVSDIMLLCSNFIPWYMWLFLHLFCPISSIFLALKDSKTNLMY